MEDRRSVRDKVGRLYRDSPEQRAISSVCWQKLLDGLRVYGYVAPRRGWGGLPLLAEAAHELVALNSPGSPFARVDGKHTFLDSLAQRALVLVPVGHYCHGAVQSSGPRGCESCMPGSWTHHAWTHYAWTHHA